MRVTLFSIGMILSSFHPSFAFEVEDRRLYTAPMPTQTIRVISTADIAAFDPLIRTFQSINQGYNSLLFFRISHLPVAPSGHKGN